MERKSVRRDENLGPKSVALITAHASNLSCRAIDQVKSRGPARQRRPARAEAAGGILTNEMKRSFLRAQRFQRERDLEANLVAGACAGKDRAVTGDGSLFAIDDETLGSLRVSEKAATRRRNPGEGRGEGTG